MRPSTMAIMLLFFSPLALAACGPSGEDDDDSTVSAQGDDDDDSSIPDADADGYEAPEDCDDNNSNIFPGAWEKCNGYDDNCDGTIDDAESLDASTFYTDGDQDGYGDPDSAVKSCSVPDNTVTTGDDCDDENAAVNPGEEEVCGDGLDNNCDDSSTPCGVSGQLDILDADISFLGAANNDQAGFSVAPGGDINGDGLDDILISAPYTEGADDTGDEPVNTVGSGSVYVIYGGLESSALNLANADAILTGLLDYDYLGWKVASAGDLDADGYDDILAGTPYDDTAGINSGAIYILNGPLSGTAPVSTARAALFGEQQGDFAGESLASAGDLNGDGYSDIIIGVHSQDNIAADAGAAYIFYSPITGDHYLSDADTVIRGDTAYLMVGQSVCSVGDINQDGYDDVAVSAHGDSSHASSGGAVLIYYGSTEGELTSSDADVALYGSIEGAAAGKTVASGGDINGDGINDLLISAPTDSHGGTDAGAVYVIYPPFDKKQYDLANADAILIGESANDKAGTSIAIAGDLNGDGYADILVGAEGTSKIPTKPGIRKVYLVYGPVSGQIDLATAQAFIVSANTALSIGSAVSSAGDFNGDSYSDILIGVPEDSEDPNYAGAAYMFFGEPAL